MNISLRATPEVKREPARILRDTARVIVRPLIPDDPPRIARLMDHVMRLSDERAERAVEQLRRDYFKRHRDLQRALERHLDAAAKVVPLPSDVTAAKRLLLGAYFTMEYSFESAALFNPSIVPHPDQSGLKAGSLRFIMSLRATGEGHISSIVFRSGVIDAQNAIVLDPAATFAELPEVERGTKKDDTNYRIRFRPETPLSERVIFPVLPFESKGMEDARFVRFTDDGGFASYFGTYTAYDGFEILPQFIRTDDFLSFDVITLGGSGVKNKGMALFPRKVNGRYAMLSRQDGETNRIMFSDSIYEWSDIEVIQRPALPWEFVQIGNCGSPLETEQGWLVLTHGVGAMRQYSIGAILLDLNDPRKVIGRLEEPLLTPNEEEREGYVPNVVYSCGSLIHNNTLILPYAMSDITSGIATVDVGELLDAMQPVS